MKNLKQNSISRSIGTLLMKNGVSFIRQGVEFEATTGNLDKLKLAFNKIGLTVSINNLDLVYYFTTWDNWRIITGAINEIISPFKWEAERFDCDQRAVLAVSLCGLLFRLNTCADLYCEVYDANTGAFKYLHHANLIVDVDGNIYLWDIDQRGMIQKITSSNIVMGSLKYKPLSIRIY